MQSGFDVPSPAGGRQQKAKLAGKAAEVSFDNRHGRGRWMEGNGNIERLGGFENGGTSHRQGLAIHGAVDDNAF